MRSFKVVWTEVALGDLERIAAVLIEEAPLRAEKTLGRIVDRGDSLNANPKRGRVPPELRLVNDNTWREVIEHPWRILYRFADSDLEIHAVVDGRRDLQDLLMERVLSS